MKKILLLIGCVFMLTGCFPEYKDYNLIINEVEGTECTPTLIAYGSGRKIMGSCIDIIKLKMTDGTINDLKTAIASGLNEESLLTVMEMKETLKDGGTTIYEGENYNIFSCKNMAGTNDMIVARKDLEYDAKLCEKWENTN